MSITFPNLLFLHPSLWPRSFRLASFLPHCLRRTRRPHKTKTQQITPSPHSSRPPCLEIPSPVVVEFLGFCAFQRHFQTFGAHPPKGLCVLLLRAFRGRNAINGTAESRFTAGGISGDGGFVGFTCEVEAFGISGLYWSFLGGLSGVENRRSFFFLPRRSQNKFPLCGLQLIHGCCEFRFRHRRRVDCSYWMLRSFVGRSLSLSRIFFWASVSVIWSQFRWVSVLQISLCVGFFLGLALTLFGNRREGQKNFVSPFRCDRRGESTFSFRSWRFWSNFDQNVKGLWLEFTG